MNFIKKILNKPYHTKGVIYSNNAKKWCAYIHYRTGKDKLHKHQIGSFDNKSEAIIARYEFIKNLI